MHRELADLISAAARQPVDFDEAIRILRRHYRFTPCAFVSGRGTARETANAAGSNAASCLLLAFASRLGLGEQATLNLYGRHYQDVLADPDGSAHANIRAFMANGWQGVVFEQDPLVLLGPG